MEHTKNNIWFQKVIEIPAVLAEIKAEIQNIDQFMLETVRLTSGIIKADLVKSGRDSVTIETNEATIVRSSILLTEETDSITITFDDSSKAGKLATIDSHHEYQFETVTNGCSLSVTVSNMHTSGILGYLYKTFGARSNGNALVEALRKYLIKQE